MSGYLMPYLETICVTFFNDVYLHLIVFIQSLQQSDAFLLFTNHNFPSIIFPTFEALLRQNACLFLDAESLTMYGCAL